MKVIKISGNTKIIDLQQEFNKEFPYLRLEFFQRAHANRGMSVKKDMLDPGLYLKHCHGKQSYGAVVLREDMKVSDLEELFKNVFGLYAQVFRKSGRSWIETTVTDDWTLQHQNEEGRELSMLTK